MDRPPAPVLTDYRAATAAGQVWVLGEPVVGVIVLISEDDSLLVENVAVNPSAQGAGYGRRLMEFAEQQAQSRGLSRMTLYTNEIMTENLAIYSRLGYCETARRIAVAGTQREGFEAFVSARGQALQRFGFLLTSDWALAEDLVQTAFARA